jgi:hypothetical protein
MEFRLLLSLNLPANFCVIPSRRVPALSFLATEAWEIVVLGRTL